MSEDKRSGYTYPAPEPRHHAKLGEAVAAYMAYNATDQDETAHQGTTRLSSKNQITLPAAMVRLVGLRPGDELDVREVDGAILLERRPRTPEEWADRLQGTLAGAPEWGTKDKIDAWVRRERDGWDRD
jgi:AbrB family looped-hinge helix DNA binding protein